MTLPDSRLRFPTSLLDFDAEVGLTGQGHESWPSAGAQPRWDWMLIWLISLLSNQASYETPTEYRDGSLWFDLNTLSLKIYSDSAWRGLADVIAISEGETSETTKSLTQYLEEIQPAVESITPSMTWSGTCTSESVTTLTVPSSLRSHVVIGRSRPLIYKNGLLLDPRLCNFSSISFIDLTGDLTIEADDTYTVIVQNIPNSMFTVADVDI